MAEHLILPLCCFVCWPISVTSRSSTCLHRIMDRNKAAVHYFESTIFRCFFFQMNKFHCENEDADLTWESKWRLHMMTRTPHTADHFFIELTKSFIHNPYFTYASNFYRVHPLIITSLPVLLSNRIYNSKSMAHHHWSIYIHANANAHAHAEREHLYILCIKYSHEN